MDLQTKFDASTLMWYSAVAPSLKIVERKKRAYCACLLPVLSIRC